MGSRTVPVALLLFSLVNPQQSATPPAGQSPTPGPPGVTNPVVISSTSPVYTKEGRDARIEGVVGLSVEILADGTVGEVAVTKSLDAATGLDAAAVEAAKKWKFQPATRDGKPVPVKVALEMRFRLYERSISAVDPEFGKGAYRVGTPGLVAAKTVKSTKPKYTPEAMSKRIEGKVNLEVVVAADGSVSDARVTKSLDKIFGLDEEALSTVRDWTFKAATLDGKAVAMVVPITLEFRLR
jgi:TonB family protein